MKYLAVLIIIFSAIPSFSQKNLRGNIDRYVRYVIDFEKHPGLIIGVIEGDSTIILSYGETKKGNQILPNEQTIFEIGSLTKVFTVTLVQQLLVEHNISQDENISKFLSIKGLENQAISIKDLMQHTSGLPRYPYGFGEAAEEYQPYKNYTKAQLYEFLNTFQFSKKREYSYSHINYTLLADLIEQVSGKSFEQYLQTKLIEPLDLSNTAVKKTNQPDMAQGYDMKGAEVPFWDVQTFEAAVGLQSSMSDLLKFLKIQFENQHELSPICLPLHQPQVKTEFKKIKGALGWHILYPYRKYHGVVSHTGATNGHQVYMAFVQETKTGIVVISNSVANRKDLGYFILKMMNYDWNRDTPEQEWKY